MENLKTKNMLQDIENAVLDHLKRNWPGVCEFDIGRAFSNLTKIPAITVTIEKIDIFEPGDEGMHSDDWDYRLLPTVSVYVIFKGVQPDARRKGVYPMIVAAAALLFGKNFGLDIDPLKNAGPITEVFSENLTAAGLACFRLDFKTGFDLSFEDDQDAVDLLVTANDYLYKGIDAGKDIINH